MQEIAKDHYYDFFEPQLKNLAGYDGIWQATSINVADPSHQSTAFVSNVGNAFACRVNHVHRVPHSYPVAGLECASPPCTCLST